MRARLLIGLLAGLLCAGASALAKDTVTVELFIMSKCPFCVQVEKDLESVVRAMGDAVVFSLDFVGAEKDGSAILICGDLDKVWRRDRVVRAERFEVPIDTIGCLLRRNRIRRSSAWRPKDES